jgi:hypothetical protein
LAVEAERTCEELKGREGRFALDTGLTFGLQCCRFHSTCSFKPPSAFFFRCSRTVAGKPIPSTCKGLVFDAGEVEVDSDEGVARRYFVRTL